MVKVKENLEELVDELMIVGNGMDLSCKLKSGYNDFFEKRYTDKIIAYMASENIFTPNYDIVKDFGLIDLILLATFKNFEGEIKWNDIESAIGDVLNLKYEYSLEKLFAYFNKVFIKQVEESGDVKKIYMKSRILKFLLAKGVIATHDDSEKIKTSLRNELVDSINKIEEEFKKYLNKNVKESEFYIGNLNKLFTHINGSNLKYTYVINFNYTCEVVEKFYEFNNVHGSLKDENRIIFGIDENFKDEIDGEHHKKFSLVDDYKLTKTYKKISLDASKLTNIKPLPKEIDTIKFFGHSLSRADYSYFQSIFDYYNIYNSSVVLKFYYINYSKDALSNQIDGMINLLKKYGSTMSNKDHGKNLLHKLSLEGRMKIEEIKVRYEEESTLVIEV